jgi:NAD(P)-dependent dehydrogenase (short-subunit alcohol dehydrogenase family)
MSTQSTTPAQTVVDDRPTAQEIVEQFGLRLADLQKKYRDSVVLITGASSGIGVETARIHAQLGATLDLTVRNLSKAQAVVDDIVKAHPPAAGRIHLLEMDLGSLASVRDAAQGFLKASGGKLNVLINNAGIMACPEGKTVDGFELQFGTNHLAHFLLTQLLTGTARIVHSGAAVSPHLSLLFRASSLSHPLR